jgi:hypothetical protein
VYGGVQVFATPPFSILGQFRSFQVDAKFYNPMARTTRLHPGQLHDSVRPDDLGLADD